MDFFSKIKISKITFYIFLSFYIVLQTLSYLYVSNQEKKAISFLNEKSLKSFKEEMQFSDNYLSKLSQTFYDTTIDTEKMRKIMARASVTKDSKQLNRLRGELYKEFLSTYNYMQTKFVRQLHFHLPGSISFLRFHRPSKFGDSLVGVRPTLEYVNETKRFVHAFEEGRIFNGFRNVYPIFKDNIFVGTVEISYSFSAIQEMIQEVDDSSFLFLINSDIVKTKVFQEETSNYKESEFSSLFYDKKTLIDQKELSLEQLHAVNAKIAPEVNKAIKNKENFSITVHNKETYKGRALTINFMPVKNFYHKQVAYIINYEFDDMVDLVLQRNKTLLIILSFLSLFISLLVGLIMQYLVKKEELAHEIATHDPLTKIYNRYGFKEIMNHRLAELHRFERDMSIVFFDIDHFKKVNDTYGHDVGDIVLKKITALVNLNIRASDIFVRWGGEEFVIILPETTLEDAIVLAEKLRVTIYKHNFGVPKEITCSFGVTSFYRDETEDDVLKRADKHLYKAKDLGRNCVVSDIES